MTFKWGCHSERVSVFLLAKPVCKNRYMYSLWPPSLCDLPISVAYSADFLSFKALDFGCGFLANAFEYTIDIQAAISMLCFFPSQLRSLQPVKVHYVPSLDTEHCCSFKIPFGIVLPPALQKCFSFARPKTYCSCMSYPILRPEQARSSKINAAPAEPTGYICSVSCTSLLWYFLHKDHTLFLLSVGEGRALQQAASRGATVVTAVSRLHQGQSRMSSSSFCCLSYILIRICVSGNLLSFLNSPSSVSLPLPFNAE